jgi:hypothetical protein
MFEFCIKIQFSDMVTDEHSPIMSSGGTATLTEAQGPDYSGMFTTHSYSRKSGACAQNTILKGKPYTFLDAYWCLCLSLWGQIYNDLVCGSQIA